MLDMYMCKKSRQPHMILHLRMDYCSKGSMFDNMSQNNNFDKCTYMMNLGRRMLLHLHIDYYSMDYNSDKLHQNNIVDKYMYMYYQVLSMIHRLCMDYYNMG